MSRFFFVLLACIMGFTTVSRSQSAEDLVEQANQAYIEGTYDYAIDLYQQVLSLQLESATLYYNLGNACFKTNRIAEAILYYERALRLKPFDENIQHNLDIARGMTVDRIDPVPRLFFHRWWQSLLFWQSVDRYAIFGLISLVLCLSACLVYFFSGKRHLKKTGFIAAGAFLLLTLTFFTLANRQYRQSYTLREAIVFTPRMTVKSGPAESNPDLFVIHEGTKVRITGELGTWVEVRLENGNIGWMHASALREI